MTQPVPGETLAVALQSNRGTADAQCMRAVALLLALGFAACSGEDRCAAANAAFRSFQQAMRSGNREAMRNCVTLESAPAIDEIRDADIAKEPAWQVVRCEDRGTELRVHARPGAQGPASEFVVVREYGRFVLDLVTTAGLYSVAASNEPEANHFEPVPLSARDLDRIRQIELARPAAPR